MILSHIVALAEDNGIGKDNDLLWRLPKDLKLFKERTLNHHILMGRKNFDSIGRPLPKRTSLIVSRNPDYQVEGCHTFTSIQGAIDFAKESGEEELFIIGGGQIYTETLDIVDRLYISRVKTTQPADVFYPEINPENWKKVHSESYTKDEKNPFDFEFEILERV